jgi:P pilus assembly protein, pilin FimA
MKLKSLCAAMVVLGLATSFAHAADGKLKFIGKIGSSTCQISGAEKAEITVPMGTIPKETLLKDANGPEVGFAINLTNCQPGTYYLVLDGTSPSGQPNILDLENTSASTTAKGVGIQIKDISDNNITLSKTLDKDDASITITENDQVGGTFFLKANYYAYNQAALTTGEANATANFTIVQQ